MQIIEDISHSLMKGDNTRVGQLTQQAVDEGIAAKTILDDGLLAGMTVIGRQFKAHEIFLPDVLLAARAMYAGLDILKPLFIAENVPSRGKVIIGTVQGDLHDIGKNLVGIMLKGAGYEVIDLGSDVSPEVFIESALTERASIIGLSALLSTTMPTMARVAALIRERGLQDKIRLIIGGAPVTDSFAEEIGADAYGFDAVKAVEIVNELMKEN